MDTEKHVLYLGSRTSGSVTGRYTIVEVDGEIYQKYYVATVDVVLSVPAITLKGRLVHGEIRPISAFGVALSRDAGCRLRTLIRWNGSRFFG